jgi:hypothetical protein
VSETRSERMLLLLFCSSYLSLSRDDLMSFNAEVKLCVNMCASAIRLNLGNLCDFIDLW